MSGHFRPARRHQQAWGSYLNTPIEQNNSIGVILVLIPPDEFLMGSSPDENALGRRMAENAKLKPDNFAWRRLGEEMPQRCCRLNRMRQGLDGELAR